MSHSPFPLCYLIVYVTDTNLRTDGRGQSLFEARHVKRSERGRAEGVAVPLEERD
mgnify:CR=1 FL=1